MSEPNNPYNTTAVQIVLPQLADLGDIAGRHTVEHGGSTRQLTDFAGIVVGRVPAELTDMFHYLIGQSWASLACFYTGNIIQGGPVQGGGPQLECGYVIFIKDNYLSNLAIVTDNFVEK